MENKILEVIEKFKNQTAKECYKISVLKGTPTILDDKIGGSPYLPLDEEYPKDKEGLPMPLLLQVNLKNINLPGYPQEGILEIFTDKDINYPCQYVVKYLQEGLEYQTKFPNIDTSNYIVTKPLKIFLKKDINYMSINDLNFINTITNIINEVYNINLSSETEFEKFINDYPLYREIEINVPSYYAYIGGNPDFAQIEIEKYKLERKTECLFKVDERLNYNICIGHKGIIFGLIDPKDIKKKYFHKTIIDWDNYDALE